MKKHFLIFILIFLLTVFAGCSRSAMPYDLPESRGKTLAAKAAGIPIYSETIEQYQANLQRAYELNREYLSTSGDLSEEERQRALDQLVPPPTKNELLQKKILRIILLKEAEKQHIPDFREEAEEQNRIALDAMNADPGSFGAKTFFAAVEQSGLTPEEYSEAVSIPSYQESFILSALQEAFEKEPDRKTVFGAETYEAYTELLLQQYDIEILADFQD